MMNHTLSPADRMFSPQAEWAVLAFTFQPHIFTCCYWNWLQANCPGFVENDKWPGLQVLLNSTHFSYINFVSCLITVSVEALSVDNVWCASVTLNVSQTLDAHTTIFGETEIKNWCGVTFWHLVMTAFPLSIYHDIYFPCKITEYSALADAVKKVKVAHIQLPSIWFRSWSRVLGSQPAGDVNHKPDGRLPLLSARPAVIPANLKRAAADFAVWWTEAQWVWTVCLRLFPDSVATAIWTRAALLCLSPAQLLVIVF